MNGHPNPSLANGESDAKGFQRKSFDTSSHQSNPLGTRQMMEEVSEHVGMNYPEIPHSRFVAQPVDDFLIPWEEAASAKNPITIDEDEGFSESRTPQNSPPQQAASMEPLPAVRSIENLQKSSAARQLFD